jgi:hypothetical protein
MQAPPPIPKSQRSDWMSRHRKGLIAVFCVVALLVVIGVGGLFVALEKLMKSSSVYSDALAKAKSSPAVSAALGTPLKDGFFFTGNISEEGSSGSARFMIPMSGPKGSGHLSVSANRSNGEWHFEDLTLLIDKTEQSINLLNTNQ